MVFSSISFIIYFLPATIAVHGLLRASRAAQNVWLLIASLAFYAWGEPAFVFVLIPLILLDYFMLLAIDRARKSRRGAYALAVAACAVNLAVPLACKQLVQIVREVAFFLSPASDIFPDAVIPLGISFFALRAVSCVIDVYKGSVKPQKNPADVALYLSFFPTLIAGPLMRYSDMEGQLRSRRESWQSFSAGVCAFITGLAKKVLIADGLAAISDHVFNYSAMSNEITRVPASLAWVGAIAFALQIYFDLSGYSDMAVGLGRMFGFELKENFDYPYAAVSMDGFWSRWNITLIGWFKEYIYFPLGGSLVKNKDKMVRNLFILWLFIGIWHGAGLTFILWGMWQFLFVVFERVVTYEKRKIPGPVRRIYVIAVVIFGFVIFRTDDIYQATLFFSNMLGFNHNGFFSDTALMFLRENRLLILAGILFSTPAAKKLSGVISDGRAGKWGAALLALYTVLMAALFYVSMVYIARVGSHPFIYFNF